MLHSYPPLPQPIKPSREESQVTIVIPPSAPKSVGGRPKGPGGNGKTLKEIAAREERALAKIELERSVTEARAAAEDIARITELRVKQREAVRENYIKQEQARAPQQQIDTGIVLKLLIALAAITFLTTAVLTADGTIGSAAAARFASPIFGFILFGAFEVAILAFMLIYYVLGSRIDYDGNPVPAGRWFFAMVVAASVTVGLSVYHVLDLYDYDWTSIAMWVGIGIRVIVALFFVIVSKGIASTVFAKAIRL